MTNYWIERFNIDNISEIDDIDKLILKNFSKLEPINLDPKEIIGFDRNTYNGDNLENINVVSRGDIEYDASQMRIIQNTRLVVKMNEIQLFSAGDSEEINKIPDLFFKKRNLVIIKNLNNNKCLLWCYIRKYLNPTKNNQSRITKKDVEISKELMDECNIDFENVSIGETDHIEDYLKCNICIFGCDKKLDSKKSLEKV